jgi:hypothetical protein
MGKKSRKRRNELKSNGKGTAIAPVKEIAPVLAMRRAFPAKVAGPVERLLLQGFNALPPCRKAEMLMMAIDAAMEEIKKGL